MRNVHVPRAAHLGGGALALLFSVFAVGARNAPAADDHASPPWRAPARAANLRNPVPPDDASRAAGKSLYARECANCHGESGKGNGPDAADLSHPPSDLTASPTTRQTDGELYWKLTEGKRPMPRFGRTLTDEQRWHVVNYIRSLAPRNN
ncbi:MAG TPA: cytochrome c [Tepidisphaeraceae bacterium]|jgi:mono/diheme cytochrome c family protein